MEIIDIHNQLAKHPEKDYKKRALDAIKYIVIHHSATEVGDAASFARYHVNHNNWPGIGYHYVILKNGVIQKTNELSTISYHVENYNLQGVGICLVGDFTKENLEGPQKQALKQLCVELFDKLSLTTEAVVGHNELGNTRCPGLDMEAMRQYLGEDQVQIFINQQKLDVPTFLEKDTTFVAIRPLAEQLGYEVKWDAENRSVYLEKKNPSDELEKVQRERDWYLNIVQKINNILSGE